LNSAKPYPATSRLQGGDRSGDRDIRLFDDVAQDVVGRAQQRLEFRGQRAKVFDTGRS